MPDRVVTDVVVQHLRRASREAGIAADALSRTSDDHRVVRELVARIDDIVRAMRRDGRRESVEQEDREWRERQAARKARVTNGK